MLPADSKSLPSYLSTPALVQCFHAMSGTGLFQADSEVPGPAAELMKNSTVVEYALLAADAQLRTAAAARRSHGDLLAAWAAQPDVQRACEHVLGLPEWREVLQPVLHGSLVSLLSVHAGSVCRVCSHVQHGTHTNLCTDRIVHWLRAPGCLARPECASVQSRVPRAGCVLM